MFKLASFALVALTAVSVVNGAALSSRKTPPAGWIAEILEPYDNYNTRYLAIGCQNKHNTQFFDDCCHPMKKGETLEKNRKAYCRPGANTPSPTPSVISLATKPSPSPATKPSSVPDEGDDCEDGDDDDDNDDDDDEDCEDDPVSSPAHTPSYTPTPVPTPSENPKPTPTPKTTSTSSPSPAKPTPVKSTPSQEPKPSPTPASSETHTGGVATWFTQNGNAGACGDTHSDSDYIAALDYRTYGNLSAKSKYCGQKIRVSWQGKSVDVIVADACPTCENSASVDLSQGAFKALAPLSVGELKDITWNLL